MGDYIKEMRALIGKRPLFNCGCGCLIFNENGQVLLQKRSDDGLWCCPGGSMDLGETVFETTKREIREETGLEIDDLELFGLYSGKTQHNIYSNGDEVYSITVIFKTANYKGEPRIDEESEALQWFDIENIPSDIIGYFVPIKEDLVKMSEGKLDKMPIL